MSRSRASAGADPAQPRRSFGSIEADVGQPCSGGFACSRDRGAFLRCDQGRMVPQGFCRGAHHCEAPLGAVRCDQSIAEKGDACTGSGNACTPDGMQMLTCRDGRAVVQSTCNIGCEVHAKMKAVACHSGPFVP